MLSHNQKYVEKKIRLHAVVYKTKIALGHGGLSNVQDGRDWLCPAAAAAAIFALPSAVRANLSSIVSVVRNFVSNFLAERLARPVDRRW